MEQLKKTLLKTSQSLDDIPVLIIEHLKKNKAKSSSLIPTKEEQQQIQKKDLKYDIIATSVVDDISEVNSAVRKEFDDLPFNIKKEDKCKHKSEPNLSLNHSNDKSIIDKDDLIGKKEKKDDHIVIDPESNINEIPIKNYLTDNNSPNNTASRNLSFNTHYKNSSECSNSNKGFSDNGNNGHFMEDDKTYKEENNDFDKGKAKENLVNIEEISVEQFFEYLNHSNISKINNESLSNDQSDAIYNLLIFDFRGNSEYRRGYISKSINVNIPSLILTRSLKYQYTNSFNIQKFVISDDKLEIENWLINNYKNNQNKSLDLITKPLIIVYDDQNLMDIDISSSPVKTFMKYLEIQHILVLNELNYSSFKDQINSEDNSSRENSISDYLLNRQLNIAWVTGGFDAICTNPNSADYIISNGHRKKETSDSYYEDACSSSINTKSTFGIDDTSEEIDVSTPIDSNFEHKIKINSDNANSKFQALNVINKKSRQKQKLALNINCAINNCSNELKTPLSAMPNSKETTINPNFSSQQKTTKPRSSSFTQKLIDEENPKNVRRKKSSLSLTINNNLVKSDQLKPQMQSNGMLGVDKNLYNQNMEDNKISSMDYNNDFLRINTFSPSSDLPLNISPTTSTVIPHYTKVLPYLYIGTETIPASKNAIERLKKLKVTHVLNVAMECNVGVTFPEDQIVYKKIDLADNLAENIAKYLWESCEWIENERKKNSDAVFYIHCKAGKSRSATVVIAYLMKVEHWSLNKSYQYLKDLRPNISPNLGFMSALLEMEAEIKKQDENNKNKNQ